MKNEDTRVQYTKARFRNAIIELLEQKAIGTVTIKELCDTAGLNRGTFYLHYTEPMDVLHEIEAEIKEETASVWFTAASIMEPLAGHLQKIWDDRRVISAVIGHNGNPKFLRGIHDMVFPKWKEHMQRMQPDMKEPELQIRFDYLYSGCTGLVTAWLLGDIDCTVQQIAELLSKLNMNVMK